MLDHQEDWDTSPTIAFRRMEEDEVLEDSEVDDEMIDDIPHEASLAMKKRLWWRSAFVTMLWILSWSARNFFSWLLDDSIRTGTFLRHCCRCTTSGCSVQIDLASRIPSSSHQCIFGFRRPLPASFVLVSHQDSDLRIPRVYELTRPSSTSSSTCHLLISNLGQESRLQPSQPRSILAPQTSHSR